MIVEHHRGRAGDLHALEQPDDGRLRVWVFEPTGPAIVLGSTQRDEVVDRERADAAGVEVVHRRSGGGAVWVAPDDPIWIDVLVPRSHPLWDDDVGRSFAPIGTAWRAALGGVGIGRPGALRVHEGAMVRTAWSGLVCFAGTGPGEVLDGHGRKLVGISQRRTRAGARFQSAVHRRWDPGPLRSLLADPPPGASLVDVGAGVGDVDTDTLVESLVEQLTFPGEDRRY